MRTGLAAAFAAVMIAGSAAAQSACGLYEAVEPGDDIAAIAARCGVTPESLRAGNPGIAEGGLRPGTVLVLDDEESVPAAPASPGGTTPGGGDPGAAEGVADGGQPRPNGAAETLVEEVPVPPPPGAKFVTPQRQAPARRQAPTASARPETPPDTDAVGQATNGGAALDTYLTRFGGLWVEPGGDCAQASDTWAFGDDMLVVRGAALPLEDVSASGEAVTLRAGPEGRSFQIEAGEGGISVLADGARQGLVACAE